MSFYRPTYLAFLPLPPFLPLLPLLLALFAGGCIFAPFTPALLEQKLQQPALSEQGQEYYLLVNRIKQENFAVDFADLRVAWTHTPQYLAAAQLEKKNLQDIYHHATSGEFRPCLQLTGTVLNGNYTSLVAHNWAAYCARGLGLQEVAAFHLSVLDSLLYSVLASGDGDSPTTAWVVTGPGELSGLLLLLGMRMERIAPEPSGENLVRIQVWDEVEEKRRHFWADYSIPIQRHQSASEAVQTLHKQDAKQ